MYGINSEPPKNCLDCPLCQGEYGKGNEKSYCAINPKVKLKYRGSRPKECPIIVDPLPQWQIEFLTALIEKTKGECRTCIHRDPEDKKCDCGAQERQGCSFPVRNNYYCKFYEKGGAE